MAIRYAKELPQDKNNQTYPALPAVPANQGWIVVPAASSTIGLTDKTTVLDLTVIGGQAGNAAVLGKWGTATASATNFDFAVNSGQSRTFVVPQSVAGTQSIAGIATQMGLYKTVTLVTATAVSASVIGAEY